MIKTDLFIYKFQMFKYLTIITLITMSTAILHVYGPECAATRMPQNIEYTLSNFGQIFYGQTIIGQIRLPNNPQLCSTDGETYINNKDPTTKDILLVLRGTCKFTQKVINAQNLGADLIIIYDNQVGDSPNVIMKNDGHGHLAQIPSLFISNTDGKKLLTTNQECPKLPVVKIIFEIQQMQTSQVTLWLDANNRESYILARDFQKNSYFKVLEKRIDLSIRFRVEDTCEDWICSKDDCVGTWTGEKFCRNVIDPDAQNINVPKGKDLIGQQLRQYYLWELLKTTDKKILWWEYMSYFDQNVCLETKDVEDCSYSAMREKKIPESTITIIKQKVQETYTNVKENKKNILKQSFQQSKELGIFFYPEATINNRNFYGLFKAPQVFQAICNSLIDPPSECIKFIQQNHQTIENNERIGLWKTIFIILLLMTIGFLIALFIYTRIIRNEVNQQLSVQVNKMVENYVNMTSTSSKKSSSGSYSKFDS